MVKISNKRKCAVTINTIRTQKEIIKRRRGANFFLQVKEKQKTSKEDIEDYFNDKEFRKKLKDERKYKKNRKVKRKARDKKIYTDETDFDEYYYHKYGWSKKGISIEEKKSGLRYSGIEK